MRKKVLYAVIFVGLGWAVYGYFSAGLHTRPPMPEGAFSLSFDDGLRGIVIDVDQNSTRRYLSLSMEVPFFLEHAWSFCTPPTDKEKAELYRQREKYPGERFEAVCRIQADDDVVVRGLIISVPKL